MQFTLFCIRTVLAYAWDGTTVLWSTGWKNRILPVVFFFDSYSMLQDIELFFCIEARQTFV